MASTKGKIGSTALIIGAWAVVLYLAYKFIPAAIRSVRGSTIAPGYQNNPVPAGSPFPSLYNGVSGYDGYGFGQGGANLTPRQILSNPNLVDPLSSNSISSLQAIAYQAQGMNVDGSPYTAAQRAQLVTQYDQPGGNLTVSSYFQTPTSDLLSFTPDGSATAVSYGSGDVSDYVPPDDPSALGDYFDGGDDPSYVSTFDDGGE